MIGIRGSYRHTIIRCLLPLLSLLVLLVIALLAQACVGPSLVLQREARAEFFRARAAVEAGAGKVARDCRDAATVAEEAVFAARPSVTPAAQEAMDHMRAACGKLPPTETGAQASRRSPPPAAVLDGGAASAALGVGVVAPAVTAPPAGANRAAPDAGAAPTVVAPSDAGSRPSVSDGGVVHG